MRGLVREFDHFVFDGRAVARSDAFDLATVERGTMNIGLQNSPRFFSCVADVAGDLRPVDSFGHERKRGRLGVARLRLELRPVNRSAVQARRGTSLQACPLEAERAQLIAEQLGWRFAVAAATVGPLAYMRQAIEKSSGGDDDSAGADGASVTEFHT